MIKGGGEVEDMDIPSNQSSSVDDEDPYTLSFCNSDCLAVKGLTGYEVSEERDLRVKYIYNSIKR
jgi:hypothetical protein